MAPSAQEVLNEARARITVLRGHGRVLWGSLVFWRWLALAALGLAVVLFIGLRLVPRQFVPPLAPAYLAVLTEPRTQRPVLVLSGARSDSALWVRTLEPRIHIAGQSLQLWALPKGRPPRPLGLLSEGDTSVVTLPQTAEHSLRDVTMLAVSLEPKGGAKGASPSGPMLYSGHCVKYW